jgi:hypothetical protein
MVAGIYQVDEDIASTYCGVSDGVSFWPLLERPKIRFHDKGLKESHEKQVELLRKHFKAFDHLHTETYGDLGMSSGYDSRMILACSRYFSLPLELHTHGTEGVHDAEARIVRAIADDSGVTLKQVSTRRMEEQTSEMITDKINDALYFYDGRCLNMGAFSDVHTSAYKKKVQGQNLMNWNGMGGEMYRNYYSSPNHSVNLRKWLYRNAYYPFAAEFWGVQDEFDDMFYRKVEKMTHRIGLPVKDKIDFLWTRRYYSEILMPDCHSAKNDAHNTLSFFHTPFMDTALVGEALNATAYIGCDGSYQAGLIHKIDSRLTKYPTHYGYTLENIPWSQKTHSLIKCHIPLQLQMNRITRILKKEAIRIVPDYLSFIAHVPILGEIRDVLCSSVIKGPYEKALIHYAQRPLTIFVGSFLREFHHKICW